MPCDTCGELECSHDLMARIERLEDEVTRLGRLLAAPRQSPIDRVEKFLLETEVVFVDGLHTYSRKLEKP